MAILHGMSWEEWLDQARSYLETEWGLSTSFSLKAATLLGYMYYYGLQPNITSGLRTAAKQKELQNRYAAGDPGIVYPPAKNSKHLTGDAIDITTTDTATAFLIAAALGIRTVSGDPVHYMV